MRRVRLVRPQVSTDPEAIGAYVRERLRPGATPADIARALGVSRQAVHARDREWGVADLLDATHEAVMADLLARIDEWLPDMISRVRNVAQNFRKARLRTLCAACKKSLEEEGLIRSRCAECTSAYQRETPRTNPSPVEYVCHGCGATYRPSLGVHRQIVFHKPPRTFCGRACYLKSGIGRRQRTVKA